MIDDSNHKNIEKYIDDKISIINIMSYENSIIISRIDIANRMEKTLLRINVSRSHYLQ